MHSLSQEHAQVFHFPSSSPTGTHLLNSRRLETRGAMGSGSSSWAKLPNLFPRPPFLRLSEPKQPSPGRVSLLLPLLSFALSCFTVPSCNKHTLKHLDSPVKSSLHEDKNPHTIRSPMQTYSGPGPLLGNTMTCFDP